jgi:chemotaxis protein MotB
VGKADTDHLVGDKPGDAKNRRVSIILLRKELTVQEGANRSTQAVKSQTVQEKRLYQKSSGSVDFP